MLTLPRSAVPPASVSHLSRDLVAIDGPAHYGTTTAPTGCPLRRCRINAPALTCRASRITTWEPISAGRYAGIALLSLGCFRDVPPVRDPARNTARRLRFPQPRALPRL